MARKLFSSHNTLFDVSLAKRQVMIAGKLLLNYQKKHPFSHIVCTGVSGQAMAWPVSFYTGIPVVVIRKTKETTHSYLKVEGEGILDNYVIVDDFYESGATINNIENTLMKHDYDYAKCVGIFLYAHSRTKKKFSTLNQKDIPIIRIPTKIIRKTRTKSSAKK